MFVGKARSLATKKHNYFGLRFKPAYRLAIALYFGHFISRCQWLLMVEQHVLNRSNKKAVMKRQTNIFGKLQGDNDHYKHPKLEGSNVDTGTWRENSEKKVELFTLEAL